MSAGQVPRDYYDILGVSREAGDAEIKKAFRKLARELHPDVNSHDPNAETKFKEAAEAYEVLSDPERRATYDRFGHEGLRSGGWAPNYEAFGSVSDIFEAFFGGSSAFGDLFGTRAAGGAVQGGDVAVSAEISLSDALHGTTAEVSYEVVAVCEHCRGNGAEPGTPIETCPRCQGSGQPREVRHGRGRKVERPKVSIDIPAGIADGQRVRVTGRGHAGERGGPAGDLYVLVRVREDSRFLRDGDDLVTAVDVAAPQAALGTTVKVPTVDGETELEIPAGTQPHETLLIRGAGMPALRGRRTGDLRVVVNVVVPRHLNRQQRELLEQLAATMTDHNLRTDDGVLGQLKRAFGGR